MFRARPHDDATLRCRLRRQPTRGIVIDQIGARLAAVYLLLDPELVIIGGGVSRAGKALLTVVERHLRRRTLVRPRLALSSLGDTAVALGATRTAIDDVERRYLSPTAEPPESQPSQSRR